MNHPRQTDGTVRLFITTHRCGSWWCPHCARRKASIARGAMLEASERWRHPVLLTLGVDRNGRGFDGRAARGWASAEEVHREVSSKSLVPRLMKRLGVERWVWCLEFQSKTGEGWPHWHVLLDAPGGFISFDELRRLWWGLWGIGNIDVRTGVSQRSAVWYIASYMSKVTETIPRWVLEREKQVRRVGASKAVGSIMRHRKAEASEADPAPAGGPDRPAGEALPGLEQVEGVKVPLLWRLAECGQLAQVRQAWQGASPTARAGEVKAWVHVEARRLFESIDPAGMRAELVNPSVVQVDVPEHLVAEVLREVTERSAIIEPRPIWVRVVDQAYRLWGGAIGARLDEHRPPPAHPYQGRHRDLCHAREAPAPPAPPAERPERVLFEHAPAGLNPWSESR